MSYSFRKFKSVFRAIGSCVSQRPAAAPSLAEERRAASEKRITADWDATALVYNPSENVVVKADTHPEVSQNAEPTRRYASTLQDKSAGDSASLIIIVHEA
jgi:hypothetical protein